ncbi:hypothetical protein WJX73_003368 [Symbiochloris irregularis]|uniref:Sulfite exporter TauE/SafE n=1 Tax=Symbiochloris irregularis TaxID=706552 RepID=A0AAW1PJM7_9CHLO
MMAERTPFAPGRWRGQLWKVTSRQSPSRVALAAVLALVLGCALSFASISLRSTVSPARDGLQRSLMSHNSNPDRDRSFTGDLRRNLPALVLTAVAASVSIAAGVGGGAFFVPLFSVLLQFTVKGATALSQASITGGALSGVACLLLRRHPLNPSKHLIDFDLALMLTPMLLLGVSMGVLANAIFPNWELVSIDELPSHSLEEEFVRQAKALPVPWVQLGELGLLWGVFLALQLLKSQQQRCKPLYFLLFAAQALTALLSGACFTWQAHKAGQGGHDTSLRRLIRASLVALGGGCVAGLLGIGGGMIVGPLMLELGVHPLVSAATSALMVLFSSSMGALAFAFDGALNLQYAAVFGGACCAASFVGVLLVARIVNQSGKASIVVMLLACIVGTGALLTAGFGGRNAVHDLSTGNHIGFAPFCR